MKSRTSGFWRSLLVGAVAFGLAACQEETVVPPPVAEVTVNVVPENASASVSGTVQFVAVVNGSTDKTVTWSANPTSVATVSATGLATCVKAGTAVVTASHASGAADAGTIVCSGGVVQGPVQITIASINAQGTNSPVNPNAVAGAVDVVLNLQSEPGQVSKVNVSMGTTEVCSQTINAGADATQGVEQGSNQTIVCTFNTASVDAQGNAQFPNGPYTVTARAFGPSNAVVATASRSIVLANANAVGLTVTPATTAINPTTGLQWVNSSVTATATPAMFAGGSVTRVTFTLNTTGGNVVRIDSTASDGFSVTWPESGTNSVPDVEDPAAFVSVATVTAAGQSGPTATSATFRLDDLAPTIGTQPTLPNGGNGWIGSNDVFADSFRTAATDGGVAGIKYTVQTMGLTASDTVWTSRANAAAIGERNTSFSVRIRVCDALDNCVNSSTLTASGIDLTDPTIQFVESTVDEGELMQTPTSNEGQYRVGFTDPGSLASQFATSTPVQVTITADTGATAKICAYGTVVSGTCTPVSEDSDIPVPAVDGYQTFNAWVMDRAGNRSNTVTRTILLDQVNPTADSVTVATAPLAGGASETFRLHGSDNLDLKTLAGQIVYGAVVSIDLGSGTVGSYGADVFTKKASTDVTEDFFIRATRDDLTNVYQAPTGVTVTATDVVGRTASSTSATAVTGISVPTTDPFATCAAGCATASADSSSTTASGSFTLTGAASINPAARAEFYRVRSGVATFLGSDTDAVVTVDNVAGTATFTYDISSFAATARSTDTVLVVFLTSGGVGLRESGAITP